jgi:glycerol-3-phosphate acyltransferase PlsX
MLKSAEATARLLLGELREAIYRSTRTKIGGLLARPAFDHVREKLSSERIGGAPLLGVNGVVIIGHGSSSALAVKNAIGQARRAVEGNLIDAIREIGVQKSVE